MDPEFVSTAEPCSVCGVLSPCGYFGDHTYSNVSYLSLPYHFMFIENDIYDYYSMACTLFYGSLD